MEQTQLAALKQLLSHIWNGQSSIPDNANNILHLRKFLAHGLKNCILKDETPDYPFICLSLGKTGQTAACLDQHDLALTLYEEALQTLQRTETDQEKDASVTIKCWQLLSYAALSQFQAVDATITTLTQSSTPSTVSLIGSAIYNAANLVQDSSPESVIAWGTAALSIQDLPDRQKAALNRIMSLTLISIGSLDEAQQYTKVVTDLEPTNPANAFLILKTALFKKELQIVDQVLSTVESLPTDLAIKLILECVSSNVTTNLTTPLLAVWRTSPLNASVQYAFLKILEKLLTNALVEEVFNLCTVIGNERCLTIPDVVSTYHTIIYNFCIENEAAETIELAMTALKIANRSKVTSLLIQWIVEYLLNNDQLSDAKELAAKAVDADLSPRSLYILCKAQIYTLSFSEALSTIDQIKELNDPDVLTLVARDSYEKKANSVCAKALDAYFHCAKQDNEIPELRTILLKLCIFTNTAAEQILKIVADNPEFKQSDIDDVVAILWNTAKSAASIKDYHTAYHLYIKCHYYAQKSTQSTTSHRSVVLATASVAYLARQNERITASELDHLLSLSDRVPDHVKNSTLITLQAEIFSKMRPSSFRQLIPYYADLELVVSGLICNIATNNALYDDALQLLTLLVKKAVTAEECDTLSQSCRFLITRNPEAPLLTILELLLSLPQVPEDEAHYFFTVLWNQGVSLSRSGNFQEAESIMSEAIKVLNYCPLSIKNNKQKFIQSYKSITSI